MLGRSLKWIGLGAAALVLGTTADLGAKEPVRVGPRPWIQAPPTASCSLTVEDELGRALPRFSHGGITWVMGELGAAYSVRVRNHGSQRIEAVVSVDGRDVLTGELADPVRHRGYVVPAHGSVQIDGFRQSLDQVAQFRFTTPGNAYTSRLGTPEHTGVIGLACFSERVTRRHRPVAPPRAKAEGRGAPAPAPKHRSQRSEASREAPSRSTDRLGTEYGESRFSPVREVRFVRRRSRPDRVITLRYDDAAGLQARGIRVFPIHRVSPPEPVHAPQPFPGRRFAPPPP